MKPWTNERVDLLIDGKGVRVGDVFRAEVGTQGKNRTFVLIDWSGCKCPPVRVRCNDLHTGHTTGCGGCQYKPGGARSKAFAATKLRQAEATLARALDMDKHQGYTAWLLPDVRAYGTKRKTQRWVGYRCPEGHEAEMLLSNFADDRGCPTCADWGIDYNAPGYLYVVAGRGWLKVGICNDHRLEGRLSEHSKQGLTEVLDEVLFDYTYDARALELLWLEQRERIPAERLPTKADLPDGYKEAAPDIPMVRRWIESNLLTLAVVA